MWETEGRSDFSLAEPIKIEFCGKCAVVVVAQFFQEKCGLKESELV